MVKNMEKSDVTDFFLEYFEKNGINKRWISENTGIEIEKISENYRQPLTATEFLELCMLLEIEPECIQKWIKTHTKKKKVVCEDANRKTESAI